MLAVNPALTVGELEQGLKRSARPHAAVPALGVCDAIKNSGRCQCTTSTCGAGILDAEQALVFASDPSGYTAPLRSTASLDSTAIRQCAVALGLTRPPDAAEPGASQPSDGGGGGAFGLEGYLALLTATIGLAAVAKRRDGL